MKRTRSVVRCGLVTTVMMTLWAMGSTRAGSENAAVAREPGLVLSPSAPGPDVPPVGASLFDLLTTSPDGRRQVPFPFEELIQRFEAAAGCSATASCVRSVLLPLGRSLQRVAASPDHFRFPRIVAGVVADGRGPWLLRDRLYVGYQARAGIIEVISYNEAAGRFEFQQVKNYRAGEQPQVVQSRRTICIACHQNHAPIFPRQVWDETNANPVLAAKLSVGRSAYFGVATRGSTDIANALDDATDRSNRLSLIQQLWQEGCGDGDEGARCRSTAFLAAVQFVLTDRRAYDDSAAFHVSVIESLQRNARSQWPGGLAVTNPDLPNRNPLAAASAHGLQAVHVPAQLDPLLPRPPLEVLPADGATLAGILVSGIADSLPTFDIERLSTALNERAVKSRAHKRVHRGRCEVTAAASITSFACTGGIELRGSFDGSIATLDALAVGSGDVLRNLRLPARRSNAQGIAITPKIRARSLRLPDGNAVSAVSIDPQGALTLAIVEDFPQLQPIAAEAAASAAGESHARRLAKVIAAVTEEPLAADHAQIAPATVEAVEQHQDAVALIAPFESRCGSCHHTADASPPNFLSGGAPRVKRALQSCAPRMLVRLAMSDLPPQQRQKTPMPPEHGGIRKQEAYGMDIRLLRAQVESTLVEEYGRVPPLQELLRNGYEALRPCLPEAL